MQTDDVETTLARVRARVTPQTLIQDLSEPLTGELDRRRIAGKFTNLETAVAELSEAVEAIDERLEERSEK